MRDQELEVSRRRLLSEGHRWDAGDGWSARLRLSVRSAQLSTEAADRSLGRFMPASCSNARTPAVECLPPPSATRWPSCQISCSGRRSERGDGLVDFVAGGAQLLPRAAGGGKAGVGALLAAATGLQAATSTLSPGRCDEASPSGPSLTRSTGLDFQHIQPPTRRPNGPLRWSAARERPARYGRQTRSVLFKQRQVAQCYSLDQRRVPR